MNTEDAIKHWKKRAVEAPLKAQRNLASNAARALELELADGIPRCACHLLTEAERKAKGIK